ncbi:uncharacterized protein BDV17DRAFT_143055 [Aspergillus undulatus]|uniref:uncharacterized protein n=1 Tax=Aspergillus undulatus TaxID=1810928 RepID=UPI003CCD59A0
MGRWKSCRGSWPPLLSAGINSGKNGIIDAAVHQWISELQSQASVPPSIRTPQGDVNVDSSEEERSTKLEFTPYKPTNIDRLVADELSLELYRKIDRGISQELIHRDWNNKRDYSYTFECEGGGRHHVQARARSQSLAKGLAAREVLSLFYSSSILLLTRLKGIRKSGATGAIAGSIQA